MYELDDAHRAGMKRIRRDPVAFVQEWLGEDIYHKQKEILLSVRDHRRTSVASCHASGKSFTAARVVIWFLHAFVNSMVITTAPTFNQVQNVLWREIRTAASRPRYPLLGTVLKTRYEIGPSWYAMGFKPADNETDRFQGFHSENILLVIDEAAGIPEPVFDATNAMMTSQDARMLLIGNPTNSAGTFYDSHHRLRTQYNTIKISAYDTPNFQAGSTVRPYLITHEWTNDVITSHGMDSPYVQSRVYANFPIIGDNTIIPLAWIEACSIQEVETTDGEIEAGLDVARFGQDENAICVRKGPKVLLEDHWGGVDTMATVARVRNILAGFPGLKRIKVDVIGVGAGVCDRLKELGYPVAGVNVGMRASDTTKWANFRHEMWWQLRERFRVSEVIGPIHDETIAQLSTVRYRYDSRHTHPYIESKDDLKARGIKSPDRAEALILAFAHLPQTDTAWEIF